MNKRLIKHITLKILDKLNIPLEEDLNIECDRYGDSYHNTANFHHDHKPHTHNNTER